MSASNSNLLISVTESEAVIKVIGRANFNVSAQFKQVVHELHKRGTKRFLLRLDECLMMDSTFLGMLAAFGLDKANAPNGDAVPEITLMNPNQRIIESLENLEVAQLFKMVETCSTSNFQPFEDATAVCDQPDAKSVTKHALEAHKTLMNIQPANVPLFKDVVRYLEEDLKRKEKPNS